MSCSTNESTVDEQKSLINKFYKLIGTYIQSEDEMKAIVKDGLDILSEITDEMLEENFQIHKRNGHSLIHELAQQYLKTWRLFQAVAETQRFQKYLDNPLYIDQYGFTVVQRLVSSNCDLPRRKDRDWTPQIQWMKDHLGVKPTDPIRDNEETIVRDYRTQ
jgi:hypothetical protein